MAIQPFRQQRVVARARDSLITTQLATIDTLQRYLLDALDALRESDYRKREVERERIIRAVGWVDE
jgi:hypothetical protein